MGIEIIPNSSAAPDSGLFTSGPFVKSPATRVFRYFLAFLKNSALIGRQYYDENRAEPFELDDLQWYPRSEPERLLDIFNAFGDKCMQHWHEIGVAAYRRVLDNNEKLGIPNAPIELADVRLVQAINEMIANQNDGDTNYACPY